MENSELLKATTTNRQREVVESYLRTGSVAQTAREFGVAQPTIGAMLKRIRRKVSREVASGHELIEQTETDEGFRLNVQSMSKIQTAAEAMAKAGIDSAIWKPIKVTANSWEVSVRLADGSFETRPLWQVKVVCERRVPDSIEEAADVLAERVFGRKMQWPKVVHTPAEDPSCVVLGLVDHHFGKLCWEPETRNSYDLDIASHLYAAATKAAVKKWEHENIGKFIIPIGNDFGHIDTRAGTTEAGTPQDTDGRYEKVAALMESAVINGVSEARKIAPVEVVWVGGNHDPITSMWLCRCIHWAFKDDPCVSVDSTPCPVKYRQFGKCLLGFAHGDAPKEKALKDLMPIEMADEWAKSKACREWLTGHLHQQKKTERIGTHEEAGMVFRILPSLCGTDSWHYRNGFSMSRKATQSYLYSYEYGLSDVAHYPVERLYAEYAAA